MSTTGKGDALRNSVLDAVLGGPDYTRVDPVWVALFTVAPTSSGGGTEVTGGGYARQSLANNSTNWPAASSFTKANGAAVDFGTATANWGTIVYGAIMDASTSGNVLYFGPLTASKTINTDDGFKIPIGGLTLTEA